MKQILFLVAALFIFSLGVAEADVSVRGYMRKDGTCVAPHHRSDPNSTTYDNWSVKPNINPYTGQPGHKNP